MLHCDPLTLTSPTDDGTVDDVCVAGKCWSGFLHVAGGRIHLHDCSEQGAMAVQSRHRAVDHSG